MSPNILVALLFKVHSVRKSLLGTFTHTKMLLYTYEEGIKQISSESANHDNFLVISASIA